MAGEGRKGLLERWERTEQKDERWGGALELLYAMACVVPFSQQTTLFAPSPPLTVCVCYACTYLCLFSMKIFLLPKKNIKYIKWAQKKKKTQKNFIEIMWLVAVYARLPNNQFEVKICFV